jgi:hypothetical protein
MEEMDGLERDLLAFSETLAYPRTPDLAAGFWRRLEAESRRRARASRLSLAGFGLALAVVVFSVIAATVGPARDAVAGLFDRINIFETSQPLDQLPTGIAGEETTIADAEIALGRALLQPSYPEGLTLERALLQDFGAAKAAVLFYRAPGGESFALFATNTQVGKGVPTGAGSSYEPVEGLGGEAYWLEGQRIVQYYNAQGNVVPQSIRVTGANTLVWDRDGFVYRIEGDIEREEAILIAHSVK